MNRNVHVHACVLVYVNAGMYSLMHIHVCMQCWVKQFGCFALVQLHFEVQVSSLVLEFHHPISHIGSPQDSCEVQAQFTSY